MGIELVVGLQPVEGLSLVTSFGYLNTEILKYEGKQQEGNDLPESPDYSLSVLGSYRTESGWFIAGDWSWRDDFFATGSISNDRVIPSYHILNLRTGFELEKISFGFSVRNVLDKKHLVGRDNFGGNYVGDRRLVGFDTTLRY